MPTPGQELSVQYSQFPCTWNPSESTFVEHQGLGSPSLVVHLSDNLPLKINGKTQFPQPDVEFEDGDVDGVGADVVDDVFVDTVEEGEDVDAEESKGAHVFKSGICSSSQLTKCETSA